MKTVKILFYGQLAEKTGVQKIEKEFSGTLSELKDLLKSDFPEIREYDWILAVNEEIVRNDPVLKEGDEIACMPPFAGG